MSELKTNQISTNDGNNVSIDNSLNLKSYTTTQRDALTSAAGDSIYNTTTSKVEYYDGSAWQQTGGDGLVPIQYLVIAGGGGSAAGESATAGGAGGGGGAGGYRNSYASETSGGNNTTEQPFRINPDGSTTYTVTVGAGGAGGSSHDDHGSPGSDSKLATVISFGGGAGAGGSSTGGPGGSGGGRGADTSQQTDPLYLGGLGVPGQGFSASQSAVYRKGGGGGGASEAGNTDGDVQGGDGLSSSITGSAVTRGGGGGGGTGANVDTQAAGGDGGGGTGGSRGVDAVNGTANTGGGAGGSGSGKSTGKTGGSGVVILRWATANATIGGTRTGLTDGGVQTDGSDSYIVFTAGTGTITFS
tara:strand:- start:46 stop:1119 length:1074 start_codon:yes stop_codon:yes gene_type:complete